MCIDTRFYLAENEGISVIVITMSGGVFSFRVIREAGGRLVEKGMENVTYLRNNQGDSFAPLQTKSPGASSREGDGQTLPTRHFCFLLPVSQIWATKQPSLHPHSVHSLPGRLWRCWMGSGNGNGGATSRRTSLPPRSETKSDWLVGNVSYVCWDIYVYCSTSDTSSLLAVYTLYGITVLTQWPGNEDMASSHERWGTRG